MGDYISVFGFWSHFLMGFLLILSILCFSFGFLITSIKDFSLARKSNIFKQYIIGNMSQYIRWCGYEFPQMEDFYNVIMEDIESGCCYGQFDIFRDKMREKYKNHVDVAVMGEK